MMIVIIVINMHELTSSLVVIIVVVVAVIIVVVSLSSKYNFMYAIYSLVYIVIGFSNFMILQYDDYNLWCDHGCNSGVARAPQAPRPRGGAEGARHRPPGKSSRHNPLARGPNKLLAGGGENRRYATGM